MSLQGKVAVITGASQGIGAGLVRGFLDRGYRVVANSRSIQPDASADVMAVAGDITDPAVADRVIGGAVGRFGRVDTLVNTADAPVPDARLPRRAAPAGADGRGPRGGRGGPLPGVGRVRDRPDPARRWRHARRPLVIRSHRHGRCTGRAPAPLRYPTAYTTERDRREDG